MREYAVSAFRVTEDEKGPCRQAFARLRALSGSLRFLKFSPVYALNKAKAPSKVRGSARTPKARQSVSTPGRICAGPMASPFLAFKLPPLSSCTKARKRTTSAVSCTKKGPPKRARKARSMLSACEVTCVCYGQCVLGTSPGRNPKHAHAGPRLLTVKVPAQVLAPRYAITSF